MNRQEQLIESLKQDIQTLYTHEDDAYYFQCLAQQEDYSEYTEEQLQSYEAQEDEAAHQVKHVIECDLAELSEIMGQKVTIEDFTNGDIFS